MNKIFKIFFSKHLNRMVIASEKSNAIGISSSKTSAIVFTALLTHTTISFAYDTGIENGKNSVAIGESSVTTGNSSIALGTGSIAIGSNLSSEQLYDLLNKQSSLVQDISSIKSEIKTKEIIYNEYTNTIDKVERNLEAIKGFQNNLNLEASKTSDISNRWNIINNEFQEKMLINNDKLKVLNSIDLSQITPTWETDGGLDKLALQLQQDVEKGSSISFGSDFYKDYIKKYINVEKNINYDSKRFDAIAGSGNFQPGLLAEGYSDSQKVIRFSTTTKRFDFQMYSFIKDAFYTDADFEKIKYQNSEYYNDFLTNFDSKIDTLKNQDDILKNLLSDDYVSKLKGDLQETFDRNNRTIRKLELDKILRYQDENDPSFASLFKERQDIINQGIGTLSLDKITTDYINLRDNYKYERLTSIQEENANNVNKIKDALNLELTEITNKKNNVDAELNKNKDLIANYEKEISNRQPTSEELAAYNKAKEIVSKLEADKALLASKENELKDVQSGLDDGENAIAIGSNALATGRNAQALGTRATAIGVDTIAIGTDSKALKNGSIAIGSLSEANAQENDIAIGKGSSTSLVIQTKEIEVDGLKYKVAGFNPTSTFSIGAPGYERTLTNVAAGQVSGTSTDAINGSQLNAVVNALEANSEKDKLNIQYTSQDKSQISLLGTNGTQITNLKDGEVSSTSKDAITGSQLHTTNQSVSQNTTNIKNIGDQVNVNTTDIKNITNNIGDLTAADQNSVKYNQDKSQISLSGTNGTQITNLKDGEVSSTSKDAITGSQLHTTNQNVSQNTTNIKNIGDQVNVNTTDIKNITNNISDLTAADQNSVKYNQDKSQISLSGTNGTQITNLKDGEVSSTSKDAITGSQLHTTNQNVSQNTTDIKNIGDQVNVNTTDIKNITNNIGDLTAADQNSVKYNQDKSQISLSGTNGTQITNLKDGEVSSTSKDAITGSQLHTTNQNVSQNTTDIKNIGDQVNVNTSDIKNIGDQVNVNTSDIKNIGDQVNVNTTDIKNIGDQVNVNTTDIKNITNNIGDLTAADQNSVKYNQDKSQISLSGTNGTQITNLKDGEVSSTSKDAITGAQLHITNQNVSQNTTDIKNIGDQINVYSTDIKNITNNIGDLTASDQNSVKYNQDKSQISLSGTNGTQITNLKDGEVSSTSKDAITGSQLHTTNQNVSQNTTNIKNIGDQVNVNTTDIKNITNNIGDLTAADQNSVKYNQDKSQVSLSGINGTKITNVKAGEISSTSKDAVTGSQLYHVANTLINDSKAYTDNRINELNNRFDKISDRANEGIASAIAIASLLQPTEKGYSMLSMGTGYWEGKQSIAIGASGVTEDKRLFNIPVNYLYKISSTTSTTNGSWGGGASIGIQWK